MCDDIISFGGEHRFLSNFYPSPLWWEGLHYPTAEHAYQAGKCLIGDDRKEFTVCMRLSAKNAKKLGNAVKMRPDWDAIKLTVMESILWQKFTPGSELARRLLGTGSRRLVEGNWWGDRFWGQCPVGTGENHLGRILMSMREELRGGCA